MKKITSLLAAAAAALSLTFTGISAAAVPAEYADISAQEEVSVLFEDNGAQVEVQQLLLAETETPVEVENTAPEEPRVTVHVWNSIVKVYDDLYTANIVNEGQDPGYDIS